MPAVQLENTQDRLPTVEDFINPQPENQESPVETEFSNSLKSGKVLTEAKSLVVEFTTDKGVVRAVDEVNLHINQGKTHGLVGESGSGKTTLGQGLAQFSTEAVGRSFYFMEIQFLPMTTKKMMSFRKSMQIIFQDPYASLNPRLTIEQTLIEPMVVHQIGSSKGTQEHVWLPCWRKLVLGPSILSVIPMNFLADKGKEYV